MTAPILMPATSRPQLDLVRALFREYVESLGIGLGFQDFETELTTLPGAYAPPTGRLVLALVAEQPAGCVGLRRLEGHICEMKRLYVRPNCRGLGLGRLLAEAAIAGARDLGYRAMRLDTLPGMEDAQRLYQTLGFRSIPAYRLNPVPGTQYLELAL